MPAEAIAPAAPVTPQTPAPKSAAPPATKPASSPTKPASPPSKPAAAAKPVAPNPPAPKLTPFDEANAAMERFSDPEPGEEKPPAPSKPAEMEEELGNETDKPADETKPVEGETKPVEGEKPKQGTSPWKLVESYKKSNAQLQKEIADLRATINPGELPKEHQERFTALETRNKELEDEIRYVNYSKSQEFKDKYDKPYEEAWQNALADLKELTVADESGGSRAATAQDMIALANMPLGEARKAAREWFGESADDVMAHRRLLRELSDKQNKALEEAKKMGSEREQHRSAEMQAQHRARAEENSKIWNANIQEATEKYEYLRPVEGETERNERLQKAVKFVDDTLKTNLGQAKTAKERDDMLKAHAAVRNRAIGFSVLKFENTALRVKLAELEKALADFQGSEPTNGDHRRSANGETSSDTMDGALAGIAKLGA